MILEQVFCIQYLVKYCKNKAIFLTLINFGSKISKIIITYAAVLGFKVYLTTIKSQKIDCSSSNTFDMIIASFQVQNKLKRDQFFEKTFFLANINMEVIFEISFLIINNAHI